ncbi:MAG: hypothetical protein WB992_04865 [Bryobacteraceae bacterium]
MKKLLGSATLLLFALTCALQAAKPQTDNSKAAPAVSATAAGRATVGAGKEIVLDNLAQYTLYEGPRRVIPDHPDAADMENERREGMKPGPVTYTGEPSPLPSTFQPPTQSPAESFAGGTESSCGGWIPSDHALASNSTYEVQILNACISVYGSLGKLQPGYPKNLNSFFGATSGDAVGDPRVLYDWHAARFIAVAEDFTANNIIVAASQTSNPTGGWWIYTLSATSGGVSGCADFPMVGQTLEEDGDTNGAIYVSFDRFACGGGFTDDVIWILPKSPIYSGAGFGWAIFDNLTVGGKTMDHVQPANVVTQGNQPRAEILVNTYDFNNNCVSGSPCNGLVLWALYNGVTGSSSNPAHLAGATISTANNYIYPVTAAQPGAASGSSCAINTGNAGITSTVTYSAGDLYLAIATGALNGGASDGWIYWQVHPYLVNNTNSPAQAVLASPPAVIRNEVCWGCNGFGGDGSASEYYPTVQPDSEGNVAIVFNYSSSGVYPSTAYIMSRSTQPSGGLPDGGLVLVSGQAEYCQLDNSNRNRWGDYTATSPFGVSNSSAPTFWFAGQSSDSSGNWATTVAKSTFYYPNEP